MARGWLFFVPLRESVLAPHDREVADGVIEQTLCQEVETMDALGRNNVVTVEMLMANPNDFEDLRKAAALEGFGKCESCRPNLPFKITGGCYTGTSTSGFEYMRAFIRGQRGKKRAMAKAVNAGGACCVCCDCPQCLKKVAGYSSGDIYQVECTNIDEDDGDDFFGSGYRGGDGDDVHGDGTAHPVKCGDDDAYNGLYAAEEAIPEDDVCYDMDSMPVLAGDMDINMTPEEYVDTYLTTQVCGYVEPVTGVQSVTRFLLPIPPHDDFKNMQWSSVVASKVLFSGESETRTIVVASKPWPRVVHEHNGSGHSPDFVLRIGGKGFYDAKFQDFCALTNYNSEEFFVEVVVLLLGKERRMRDAILPAIPMHIVIADEDGFRSPAKAAAVGGVASASPLQRVVRAATFSPGVGMAEREAEDEHHVFILSDKGDYYAVRLPGGRSNLTGIMYLTPRKKVWCMSCNTCNNCEHLSFWLRNIVEFTEPVDEADEEFIDSHYSTTIDSQYFPEGGSPMAMSYRPLDSRGELYNVWLQRISRPLSSDTTKTLFSRCKCNLGDAEPCVADAVVRSAIVFAELEAIKVDVFVEHKCVACGSTISYNPQDDFLTCVRWPDHGLLQRKNSYSHLAWFVCNKELAELVLNISRATVTRSKWFYDMSLRYRNTGTAQLLPGRTDVINMAMKYIDKVLRMQAERGVTSMTCSSCNEHAVGGDGKCMGILKKLLPPSMQKRDLFNRPSKQLLPPVLLSRFVVKQGLPLGVLTLLQGKTANDLFIATRTAAGTSRAAKAGAVTAEQWASAMTSVSNMHDNDPFRNALAFLPREVLNLEDMHTKLSSAERLLLRDISSQSVFSTGRGLTLAYTLALLGGNHDVYIGNNIPTFDHLPSASVVGRHDLAEALERKARHFSPYDDPEVSLLALLEYFKKKSAGDEDALRVNMDLATNAMNVLREAGGVDDFATRMNDYLVRVAPLRDAFGVEHTTVRAADVLRDWYPPLYDIALSNSGRMPERWKLFCLAYANKLLHAFVTEPPFRHKKLPPAKHDHDGLAALMLKCGNLQMNQSNYSTLAYRLNDLLDVDFKNDRKQDPIIALSRQVLECEMLRPMDREESRGCGSIPGSQWRKCTTRGSLYQADLKSGTLGATAAMNLQRDNVNVTDRFPAKMWNSADYEHGGPTCGKGVPSHDLYGWDLAVLTCLCSKQKIVYAGFLDSGESSRHFFDMARRKDAPPPIMVYDNACALHAYAMTREPHFFWGTRFLIDKFHCEDHVACTPLYHPKWWNRTSSVNGLITATMEQHNSRLQSTSKHMQFMKMPNALNHLEAFCELCNTVAMDGSLPQSAKKGPAHGKRQRS